MAIRETDMTPILMIHEHPEIKRFQEQTDQKLSFIKKQMNDLQEKQEKIIEEFWINLHDYLDSKKIMKNSRKTRLKFRDGVIYQMKSGSNSIGPTISEIISHIFH